FHHTWDTTGRSGRRVENHVEMPRRERVVAEESRQVGGSQAELVQEHEEVEDHDRERRSERERLLPSVVGAHEPGQRYQRPTGLPEWRERADAHGTDRPGRAHVASGYPLQGRSAGAGA